MNKGESTKERILEEALAVFAEKGYEGARIDSIAVAVGINKASLYFHFKSKEELFKELFYHIIRKYQAEMKHIVNVDHSLSVKEQLTIIYRDYLEYNWRNTEMEFWNRVYYLPPSFLKDEIFAITYETKKEFVKQLAQIFEEGIKRNELCKENSVAMANTFYYVLTCIDLSTDIMKTKEEALQDMESCFQILWNGIKG